MFLIKILVIQKELSDAIEIYESLKQMNFKVLDPIDNYQKAKNILKTEAPDLVLLDYELTGPKNGLLLAEEIQSKFNIPIIFLTRKSDEESLKKIKKLGPSNYLHFPFKQFELKYSIEVAFQVQLFKTLDKMQLSNSNNLIIKDKKVLKKINFMDILFLKSDDNYVEIHTEKGSLYLIRESLNQIARKLDRDFMQIHRSYIINLTKITAVKSAHVIIGKNEIPLSRSNRKYIIDYFKEK
jgi:two-component system response regulator LytT